MKCTSPLVTFECPITNSNLKRCILSNLHISKCMVRVDRKPTDSAIRDSIYRYVTLAKWWWRRALVMMIRLYVQLGVVCSTMPSLPGHIIFKYNPASLLARPLITLCTISIWRWRLLKERIVAVKGFGIFQVYFLFFSSFEQNDSCTEAWNDRRHHLLSWKQFFLKSGKILFPTAFFKNVSHNRIHFL